MRRPLFASRRFTATLVALAFVILEGGLRNVGCGVSDEVLLAAIALVGGLVAGDSYRPSGFVKGRPEVAATPQE